MEPLEKDRRVEESRARKIRRLVVLSGAAVFFVLLFGFLVYAAQDMLLPLILGGFLAYLLRPLVTFRGTPLRKYLRAALVIGGFFFVSYGLVRLVRSSWPTEKGKLEMMVRLQYHMNNRYTQWMGLTEPGAKGNWVYRMFRKELDPAVEKLDQMLSLTPEQVHLFLRYHQGHNNEPPISDKFYQYFQENLRRSNRPVAKEEPSAAPVVEGETRSPSSLGHWVHSASVWLVFPLSFLFFLFDKGVVFHSLVSRVPNRYFELTKTVLDRVDLALGHYIRGTLLECFLVGVALTLGFLLCGIPFQVAVFIGVVGGLTNAVPFVGTLIAASLAAAYALIAEDISPILPFVTTDNLFLAAIGVVMVAHLLDNAIFQPLVVGSAVNLHPLVVIIGVFGGSLAFGFAGLLLAIPTIVVFRVVVQNLFSGLKAYKII